MSEIYCKGCKKIINILKDKYFRITVDYDTSFRDIKIVYRFHRQCWLDMVGMKNAN